MLHFQVKWQKYTQHGNSHSSEDILRRKAKNATGITKYTFIWMFAHEFVWYTFVLIKLITQSMPLSDFQTYNALQKSQKKL